MGPATSIDQLHVQMRDGELWVVDTRGDGTVLAILPMRDAATLAERLRILTRPAEGDSVHTNVAEDVDLDRSTLPAVMPGWPARSGCPRDR